MAFFSCSGYKDVCLILVKHGADIHKEDTDGDTPLRLAKSNDLKRDMQRKSTVLSEMLGLWLVVLG